MKTEDEVEICKIDILQGGCFLLGDIMETFGQRRIMDARVLELFGCIT